VIRQADRVPLGSSIQVRLHRGALRATVTGTEMEPGKENL
jgi:hypothetical protein